VAIEARVPGHVHLDLLREKLIPDPFWRDQADQCQWVEQGSWVYEREFDVPSERIGVAASLCFDGLDTYAAIYLNGELLGRTANMFVSHRFEVGALLRPRSNTLRVCFGSIWDHVGNKPRDAECAFENQERLYVRRMQCTFHWDWVNRFVSAGIWRSVTLRFHGRAELRDILVSTRELRRRADGSLSDAVLRIRCEAERFAAGNLVAKIELLGPDAEQVWAREVPFDPTRPEIELEAVFSHPRLWWPNGLGEQSLYQARVCLCDEASGTEFDRRELNFGVRTVQIERRADAPGSAEEARTRELRARHPERDARNGDAPGESFAVVVNGERIFCKGANWVPADPWPSRITESHYERLLSLAHDAHVNCLRAWGGGIYEPEAFWRACDRLGILVAQDFQTACGHYPEHDPDFMAAMRAEIPAAIRLLRNHPSLAWWIGDNENGMKFDFDDPATAGRRIAEEIARPSLRELDPDRPFEPTSPFGGRPNNCQTIGDTHLSALPHNQAGFERDWRGYRRWIDESIGRFNSECVTAGAPPLRSLRRFMSESDIADPHSPLWYFHTKDNPYTDVRLFDVQRKSAEKLFGPLLRGADFVPRLEYLQYEFARLTIESARRWKGYNQGLLFWMFNDCWPATGWSFVDYYGIPKAAWYAMKRGFAPVIVVIEEAGERYRIWVCNDRRQAVDVELEIRRVAWSAGTGGEAVRRLRFEAPANASTVALELSKDEFPPTREGVLVCGLRVPEGEGPRAWHFDGLPGEMKPPPTKLCWAANPDTDGRSGMLEIQSSSYARVVTIDGEVDLSDNYFEMLPGERRVVSWRLKAEAERPAISITCWNASDDAS
jgi:beta-mannosidase